MRAEIVAVGTELLLGQIANTNAQRISVGLAAAGVDVLLHTAVGDNEQRIAGAVASALARVDLVITTGGLGPTHDDLTREGIARATGRRLVRRADLEQALAARFALLGRAMAQSNLRQADVPEGASPIENPVGSAPGLFVEHEGRRIYALPGVPAELEAMLEASVLPELARLAGGAVIVSRILKLAGIAESEVVHLLGEVIGRLDREPHVTLAVLSSAGEVRVRLTAKAAGRGEALARIAPVDREVRAILGRAVFGADDQTIEGAVSALLRRRGLTLALAESVTGGLLASRIVSVPGASDLLRAGYVAYSPEAKVRDLGVPREVLERRGAVSVETAEAMARGARDRAGADVALSTTGEAGPGAAEAPAGTVCAGLAWAGGAFAKRMVVPGDREGIRRRASQAALDLLRLWLLGAGG